MDSSISIHLASPKWIRLVAASSALLLIAIAIALTAGQGGGDGGQSAARQKTDSNPAPAASGEHEHFSDIYVVDVRSRRLTRVTQYQLAQQPAWSPNRRIAFAAANCDDCYTRLFHVDSRGVDQVLIRSPGVRHLFHPTWSPDGRTIAALVLGKGIYSIALSGPRTRRLTSGQSDEAPAWSPKGDWIAFDRQTHGANYDLYEVNPVTRKLKRLTHDPSPEINPSWSPDGSRIVFAEQQANGKWGIVTMKLDGSGRRRITGSGMSAQEPAWSPDGRKIAFTRQALDRASIAVIAANGHGKIRRMTGRSLFPSKPAWSPDGKSIAFSATKQTGG